MSAALSAAVHAFNICSGVCGAVDALAVPAGTGTAVDAGALLALAISEDVGGVSRVGDLLHAKDAIADNERRRCRRTRAAYLAPSFGQIRCARFGSGKCLRVRVCA